MSIKNKLEEKNIAKQSRESRTLRAGPVAEAISLPDQRTRKFNDFDYGGRALEAAQSCGPRRGHGETQAPDVSTYVGSMPTKSAGTAQLFGCNQATRAPRETGSLWVERVHFTQNTCGDCGGGFVGNGSGGFVRNDSGRFVRNDSGGFVGNSRGRFVGNRR